jgi:hypothetical protein
VGRFLAQVSSLEAASVHAFRRLTQELEEHGAPLRLRSASRRAACDEVRHAKMTKRLAERAGAHVVHPRMKTVPGRSLEAMAIENAIEGCVRETFGAAVASMQAESAQDSRVRAVMKRIAADETRHADLSWRVARWLDGKLDLEARERVRQARCQAVESLLRDLDDEPEALVRDRLGLPTAERARRAAEALRTMLWS